MSAIEKYLGIPYKSKGRDFSGCDCWGLVVLFYKNEFNVDLPSYDRWYVDVENLEVLDYTVTNNRATLYEEVKEPKYGDIVLFRIKGYVVHCGIVLNNNMFLHNFYGTNSCIESITSFKWNKRIDGFYRYG